MGGVPYWKTTPYIETLQASSCGSTLYNLVQSKDEGLLSTRVELDCRIIPAADDAAADADADDDANAKDEGLLVLGSS